MTKMQITRRKALGYTMAAASTAMITGTGAQIALSATHINKSLR